MAHGLSPSEFWVQSPRSFVSIMEGCSRAAKRESDAMLSQAWHIEAFARQKRLKPLDKILAGKPKVVRRKQTPDEMFAILQLYHTGGAPMNIREIN